MLNIKAILNFFHNWLYEKKKMGEAFKETFIFDIWLELAAMH
jgi:hypothetical protein